MTINFSENFFSSCKVLLNLSQIFYSCNFLSVLLRLLKKQNKTKQEKATQIVPRIHPWVLLTCSEW